MEAYVVCHKSNMKQLYSKTHDLFRQCFLTLLLVIYNLGVSFHFHLTFLQLNVKCLLCSKNCFFFPHSQLFSSSSRYLERFSISLEGSSYPESTVVSNYILDVLTT